MRLTRDEVLMEHAKVASYRGTCDRLKVGAVFSIQGRVVATGYNGAPMGVEHCNHICDCNGVGSPLRGLHSSNCKSETPCRIANHAERNAVDFAARHGVSLGNTELHVTHAPCWSCASSLINAGVVRVVYHTPYRLDEGVELLASQGIEVIDFRRRLI